EGDYPIICAELCGAYHGGMKSVLHVDSAEAYAEWEQANKPVQEANMGETALVDPKNMSDPEFLSPYAEEMGMNHNMVAELANHNSDHAF
ncbi:MAG: cytochrome C oxidase subunit II, partial [Crocosphaera sp.]|nr:cytochrome C oxidase subunit II [Crocosphaera sp.]